MDGSREDLYISNMKRTGGITSYNLFGETDEMADVVHCETIAARSVLHDWQLSPHRHARLHQVLLLASGGGVALVEEEERALGRLRCLTTLPALPRHSFQGVHAHAAGILAVAGP